MTKRLKKRLVTNEDLHRMGVKTEDLSGAQLIQLMEGEPIEWPVDPQTQPKASWDISGLYYNGVMITGVVTFICSWIYCIATYGFLFGVGLGWLPSIIVAWLAGYLWPLLVLAIAVILLFIGNSI